MSTYGKAKLWGVSALLLGSIATWMTPNIVYVLIALGVLVVLDILFNIGDEQREFQAVARLMLAAILPLGLRFIGSQGAFSKQFFFLGLAIAFGVLLNRVVPRIINAISYLVSKTFPKSEQAAIDNSLVAQLQSTIDSLTKKLTEMEKTAEQQTGVTVPPVVADNSLVSTGSNESPLEPLLPKE